MDRAMQLRHLDLAERHIAEGVRHIAEQEQRLADLALQGFNTMEARKLLDSFYPVQMLHVQHRHRILKELEDKAARSLLSETHRA